MRITPVSVGGVILEWHLAFKVTEVIKVIGYQLWRGVLWRPSRHGARSGQGGVWVLEMELKSGGVPAVLSGAMISLCVGCWRR
jgi:hypothetical protein